MRVAFCVVPHVGGIFSVYRKLRNSLREVGIDVVGLQIGPDADRWEVQNELADSGCISLVPEEKDLSRSAKYLDRWLEENSIDILMPMVSPVALAAVPHLSSGVRVVTRCISIGAQSCRLATSELGYVSKIVYSSPAQREELIRHYGVCDEILAHCPNCVDCSVYSPDASIRARESTFTITYLGRLIQQQKNVFLLPEICQLLKEKCVDFNLRIIGNGPDELELRLRLKNVLEENRVQFVGAIHPASVPPLLAESDCLILPSVEEGFPNALIEGMACGAVPVASRLGGITDWIVDHRASGYLCKPNSSAEFARAIAEIAGDPQSADRMRMAAVKSVNERFSSRTFQQNWLSVFQDVRNSNASRPAPKSWDQFSPSPALRRSRFGWIPKGFRNAVRSTGRRLGFRLR